jgi:hypothetical protein
MTTVELECMEDFSTLFDMGNGGLQAAETRLRGWAVRGIGSEFDVFNIMATIYEMEKLLGYTIDEDRLQGRIILPNRKVVIDGYEMTWVELLRGQYCGYKGLIACLDEKVAQELSIRSPENIVSYAVMLHYIMSGRRSAEELTRLLLSFKFLTATTWPLMMSVEDFLEGLATPNPTNFSDKYVVPIMQAVYQNEDDAVIMKLEDILSTFIRQSLHRITRYGMPLMNLPLPVIIDVIQQYPNINTVRTRDE